MSNDKRVSGFELLKKHVNKELPRAYTSSYFNPQVYKAIESLSSERDKSLKCFEFGASGGELGLQLLANGVVDSYLGCEVDSKAVSDAKAKGISLLEERAEDTLLLKKDLISRHNLFIYADVLEHLVDPWAHLYALCNLVETGSSVVVSIPCFFHHSNLANLGAYDFQHEEWGVMDLTHLRHFGLRNMLEMLSLAGFSKVRTISPALDPEGQMIFEKHKDILPVDLSFRDLSLRVRTVEQLLQICSYQFILCAEKP